MQMSSGTIHDFKFFGGVLENVARFVYLGWLIVRKLRNCDDDQAAKQAGRLYAAAHETSQAYKFTRQLPWDQRVNFAKTFGGIYAPECYTSLSSRALSKLRAAHRYLYMRLTGWTGEECFDDEATVRSLSIGSTDSDEEYYDTRSRWLYAYAAATEKLTQYRNVGRGSGRLDVEHLQPAPTIEYQLRKARHRIRKVMNGLNLDLEMSTIRLSKTLIDVVAPG